MNSFLSLANLLMEDAVCFHEPSAAVLSRFFQQHRMARHQRDLLADILFTGLRHRQKINTFLDTKPMRKKLCLAVFTMPMPCTMYWTIYRHKINKQLPI